MKQCLRCKELIVDEATECPNCNTKFTGKEMELMKENAQSTQVRDLIREREKVVHFRKVRGIMVGILTGSLGVLVLSTVISLLIVGNMKILYGGLIAFFVLFLAGVVYSLVSGALFCPHCGRALMRTFGKNCMYCGKKIIYPKNK